MEINWAHPRGSSVRVSLDRHGSGGTRGLKKGGGGILEGEGHVKHEERMWIKTCDYSSLDEPGRRAQDRYCWKTAWVWLVACPG